MNYRAYWTLCKHRVVALMLVTAWVGMLLSTKTGVPWSVMLFGLLGIGFCAAAGATVNHLADRHIDALMQRTRHRPLPMGALSVWHAGIFAAVLTLVGMGLLLAFVNVLTAALTFLTLIGYGAIYTLFLKRATPQNIVIGGFAGAMPPLLGWVAVTGTVDYGALLLVLIIFAWTPPHFWALAIDRCKEYAKADIPMLPVVHGIQFTKLNILIYTVLLFAVSLLPFVVDMSGLIYSVGAVVLGVIFLYWAIRLYRTEDAAVPMKVFRYSIVYLCVLFIVLLVDHYWPLLT